MSWAKWYKVSLIQTIKTFPIDVKANSIEEALGSFQKMLLSGENIREQEKTHQFIVTEIWKRF